jgi:DNA-binding transcriptional LysR family regulator
VKEAVIGGFGISFVSEMSVRKECARGELLQVRVSGLSLSRNFYPASRQGRELSPAAKAFTALLVEQYGNAWNEVKTKEADT